ncbi:hypothetical protein D3C75_1163520 [compost metagenome]
MNVSSPRSSFTLAATCQNSRQASSEARRTGQRLRLQVMSVPPGQRWATSFWLALTKSSASPPWALAYCSAWSLSRNAASSPLALRTNQAWFASNLIPLSAAWA